MDDQLLIILLLLLFHRLIGLSLYKKKKRALVESDSGKPGLEVSDNSSSKIKSNGILNKVFKVARKNKNSFEKMWNRD